LRALDASTGAAPAPIAIVASSISASELIEILIAILFFI
jgi:hypothetical protein